MFERYTEKARRTIFFARYEASQYGSPYIEVVHLLLGLMREDWPTFARVSDAGRLEMLRAFEGLCTKSEEKIATSVDLPVSDPCKRVFAYAAEEAQRMGHSHIGPEHLLLGVLRLNGPEAGVLASFGVDLESARLKFGSPATGPGTAREALEKLLAEVPEDRLEATARILTGLGSEYFAVGGVSAEGPFSYAFGSPPPGM
jgi:ATP-dependent Clp protease ATP-binding subunit ClpC